MILALGCVSAMSIIACLSCRFFVRAIGFVIMGLVLNAKRSTPYLTFAYVLVNHTSRYYKHLQTRYKEIKNMIYKKWTKLNQGSIANNCSGSEATLPLEKEREQREERRGTETGWERAAEIEPKQNVDHEGAIRLDLFWYVCNERKVLPLLEELSLMYVNVVVFASILFLALAGVVFFGAEYNSSSIVSAAAILISGKLPEWLFKKMIKRENFTDKEKLEKVKKVNKAVNNFRVEEKLA